MKILYRVSNMGYGNSIWQFEIEANTQKEVIKEIKNKGFDVKGWVIDKI